ncbi:hypothetical protein ACS0TY_033748 [Phlomoides rotata]
MLDEIRIDAMKRLATNKDMVTSQWSPSCMQIYQDNMEAAFGCKVIFNGEVGYEIGDGDDRQTGMAPHWNPILSCNLCTPPFEDTHLTLVSQKYLYNNLPMPGRKFMNCDTYEKIEPPPVCKMPGRPKKKIIRGRNELTTRTSGKLSKIGKRMTCSSCHQEGHNSVKCSYKKSQPGF